MGIMELYERHGVSNQYQLDYLFNSLFILTALETKRARIAGPLCLCADRGGFPAQIDSSVESISIHDVIMRKEMKNKDQIFGKMKKMPMAFRSQYMDI